MSPIQNEVISVSALLIFRILMPQKNKLRDCLFFIFAFICAHFLATSLEASQVDLKSMSTKDFISYLERKEDSVLFKNPEMEWSQEQIDFLIRKIEFHDENAKRTFNDAKDRCWWLPQVDYRIKAQNCFAAIFVTIAPGTPQSKLISGLLTLLCSYGINCLDEWEYIENKLMWCEYHYAQKEYYESLLIEECEP
ncbi:hypothetical protein [Criblamydia sequanensis]|uniref:Membrane protein n=1 Tax=Candidatus Criblamydia sequanensis CRIB-18 TaxID=1437425 RepID=A0A090D2D3_9BACT|nr:hypothetical protein [Criblamydia sequanensis]CDR34560.1 Putative membrane protein [Criblamydia sequanensis CRIB-18]